MNVLRIPINKCWISLSLYMSLRGCWAGIGTLFHYPVVVWLIQVFTLRLVRRYLGTYVSIDELMVGGGILCM
jgi:hypothetical protein